MKKILFFSVIALAMSCCGPKSNEVCVDKLIASPAEFVGKDIKFVGTAFIANAEEKRIAVFGSDSTKYIVVQSLDTAKICCKLCGQQVKVAGTVVAVEEGIVIADSVKLGDACSWVVVAEGYYVAAKCICKAECCKKDGEKKCCKKDGEEKKECPANKE